MGTTRQKSSCRNRLQNGPHSLLRMKVGTSRLCSKNRTQRPTRRNRGHFGWGWYHYPRTVLRGSETLRGQGAERCTLPLLGLGRGCSRRTQRACGTAMRSCASLSRGVAAPLGCVIQWVRYRCFPLTAIQTIVAVAGLPMTFATQLLGSAFDVDEPTVTQNIQRPFDAGT